MRIETTLLLLACAWPVAAQEGGKTTPAPQQKDKPMTGAVHQDKRMVVKGEAVLGADIRVGGEDIGDVKDFVVDRDGQILYAILDIDEGDDKRIAVPWNALRVAVDKDGDDADDYEFDVVVDKERLRAAPGFTEDKWPNLASNEWSRETDEFFRDLGDTGRPRPAAADESAGARPAGMARAMAVRATKLQGIQVDTSSGKNAGEIENVAIDPKNGRIAFVVLSTGGFLGLGEDHHAIPLQAFTFSREADDKDDVECRLNIPESKLENAPKFDKSDWDAAGDVVFVEKIYSHYGYPAYWNDRAMPGHGNTPTPPKKPGETGDDEDGDGDDRR